MRKQLRQMDLFSQAIRVKLVLSEDHELVRPSPCRRCVDFHEANSELTLRYPEFCFRVNDLKQCKQSVRRKAFDPMAKDLAHLGFVGTQDISQRLDRECVLLLVGHEFLADIPPELFTRRRVRGKHERAFRFLQFFPNFFQLRL